MSAHADADLDIAHSESCYDVFSVRDPVDGNTFTHFAKRARGNFP